MIAKDNAELKHSFSTGNYTRASSILETEWLRLVGLLRKATDMNTVRHLQGQLDVVDNVREALS